MATQTIQRPVRQRATNLEALFPGRFLNVTSFKRDGTGVATPVWSVSDGVRLFAFTDLSSAKVRRIRRNAHVLVASCRPDGKLRGEPIPARAEVLTATRDLERVRKLLIERYKLTYRVVMLFYRVGRRLHASPTVRGLRSQSSSAGVGVCRAGWRTGSQPSLSVDRPFDAPEKITATS